MIHRYATNIRFAGALPTSRSQSGNAFLECSVWLVSVWSATRKLKSVGVTSPFHQLLCPDARFRVVGEIAC